MWEWKNMFQLPLTLAFFMFMVLAIILALTTRNAQNENYLFVLYAFLPLFLLKKITLHQILYTILGVIYLCIPVYVLYVTAKQAPFYLRTLFVITIVWASDISAYLTGKYFGKHLLLPRISPKKTWEGLIGSFFFSAIAVFVWFQFGFVKEQKYVWIGVLTAVSAPVGDLVESAIKRNVEIKDTSQLLPGHGGFLDRFDGFFFAVVAQYWI